MHTKRRSQRGFGLVEILVVLAVVAVVMGAAGLLKSIDYDSFDADELTAQQYRVVGESFHMDDRIGHSSYRNVVLRGSDGTMIFVKQDLIRISANVEVLKSTPGGLRPGYLYKVSEPAEPDGQNPIQFELIGPIPPEE